MTTRHDSLPGTPWSTRTSVRLPAPLPAPAPRGCRPPLPAPTPCPEPTSSSLPLAPFTAQHHPDGSPRPSAVPVALPRLGGGGQRGTSVRGALTDASCLPLRPADPIAKDPARIGTSAGLSASNTPVSSSSMLAGECSSPRGSRRGLRDPLTAPQDPAPPAPSSPAHPLALSGAGITSMSASQPIGSLAASPVISSPNALGSPVPAAAGVQP